mmetsp:Transcript_21959/g.52747  ORF Transcript_21959/g.52747 Transcript_21959/m.52747 type:complete len:259 (+) Transcript_21959:102-878(+)
MVRVDAAPPEESSDRRAPHPRRALGALGADLQLLGASQVLRDGSRLHFHAQLHDLHHGSADADVARDGRELAAAYGCRNGRDHSRGERLCLLGRRVRRQRTPADIRGRGDRVFPEHLERGRRLLSLPLLGRVHLAEHVSRGGVLEHLHIHKRQDDPPIPRRLGDRPGEHSRGGQGGSPGVNVPMGEGDITRGVGAAAVRAGVPVLLAAVPAPLLDQRDARAPRPRHPPHGGADRDVHVRADGRARRVRGGHRLGLDPH